MQELDGGTAGLTDSLHAKKVCSPRAWVAAEDERSFLEKRRLFFRGLWGLLGDRLCSPRLPYRFFAFVSVVLCVVLFRLSLQRRVANASGVRGDRVDEAAHPAARRAHEPRVDGDD